MKKWIFAILVAICVLFTVGIILLRIFVFQLYRVPTTAMAETIPATTYLIGNTMAKEPKRNDIIIFNNPDDDTTALEYRYGLSYYVLVRKHGREYVHENFTIQYNPINKRTRYVFRCVGIASDSLKIEDGTVFIDNKPEEKLASYKSSYLVRFSLQANVEEHLNSLEFYNQSVDYPGTYIMHLTKEKLTEFEATDDIILIEKMEFSKSSQNIYPYNTEFYWSTDNFGSLWIPAKDSTIELTEKNLILYERAISTYEDVIFARRDGHIWIDGEMATEYTFMQDYYFVMGDNRHNAQDSRYIGLIPHNHIRGKVAHIF